MNEHQPNEFVRGTIVSLLGGNERWEVYRIDEHGWVLMTNFQQVHYSELEIQEA